MKLHKKLSVTFITYEQIFTPGLYTLHVIILFKMISPLPKTDQHIYSVQVSKNYQVEHIVVNMIIFLNFFDERKIVANKRNLCDWYSVTVTISYKTLNPIYNDRHTFTSIGFSHSNAPTHKVSICRNY